MPDVGTLTLSIESNAGEAAKGVGQLAKKLAEAKSAASGFDLSSVATQIEGIVNGVKDSSKTVSALGSLFKGLAEFSKVKISSFSKDQIERINQLKQALGSGWNVGQAGTQLNKIRDALTLEWNTENATNVNSALIAIGDGVRSVSGSGIKSVATNLGTLAQKMNEFADAAGKIASSSGAHDMFMQAFPTMQTSKSLGNDAVAGYENAWKDGKDAIANAVSGSIEAGFDAGADTQESHSPSLVYMRLGTYAAEGYIEGVRSKTADVIKIVSDMVRSAILGAKGEIPTLGKELSDAITKAFDITNKESFPDAVKTPIIEQANRVAAYVKETLETASKEDYTETADTLANRVATDLNEATGQAFGSLKWETGVNAVETETPGLYEAKQASDELAGSVEKVADAFTNVSSQVQNANENIEETLKKRKEMNAAADQKLLESNYAGFREMYLSGDNDLQQMAMEKYGFTPRAFEEGETYAKALEITMQGVNKYVDDFIAKTNQPAGPLLRDFIDENILSNQAGFTPKQIAEWSTRFTQSPNYTEVVEGMEQVTSAVQPMKEAMGQAKTTTRVLADDMKDLDKELKEKKKDVGGASGAFSKFGQSLKKLFPTLSSMLTRFKAIAKYRFLRAVLKQITSGVSEGLENLYFYSKAVGTDFAPAMDSAASALAQMKNSVGAALAPAIQAVIPLLNTLVSGFVNVVNLVNQFFALLTGQKTWTRALLTDVDAYEDKTKKAKGNAKEMKDMLADWDELNIIQSQSGGGGSGASGKTQPNYSEMFEQVNEFDEGVKRVFDFINDHMHGLLSLVGRIAAIIYGIKFSKLFTGWLGKLGKIVAGASLITIGVELAYGSSFEAGEKGYFDTTDLLGTIGGVIASGIGGYMIGTAIAGPFGGKVGLVIGLGVGIIAAIKGYIDGKKDAADAAKWGNLHKTREEIEEFVKKQFSFDVEASITVLDASIANQKEAQQTFRLKVTQFSASLGKAEYAVAMHVDKDKESESLKRAFADSQEAIAALQAMIDSDNKGLTVLFKEVKFKNSSGEDINDEIMANVNVGDTFLSNYFTGLGKQAADLFYEGQRTEWANGEKEQILALFNSQNNIMSGALELKDQMEFNAKMRASNSRIIDRDTAETEMQYQKEQLDQYRQKVKEAVLYDADQMLMKAAMSKKIWEEEFNNGNMFKAAFAWTSYKLYEDSADAILSDVDRAVEERLGPTKEKMKEDWGNVLREVYGTDFSDNINTLDWLMGSFIPEGERASENEIETMAGFMKDKFNIALAGIDTKGIMKNATKELGMNLWTDFFNEAQKQDVFDATVNFAKNPGDAAIIIMKAFGVDAKAVAPYLANYQFRPISDGISEYFRKAFEEADKQIKEQNYSEDLIKDFVSAGIDFESEFKKQYSGHSLIDWVNGSKDAGENKNHYIRDFLGIDDNEQVTISIVPVLDSKDDQQWLLDWLAQEGDKMTALLAKESSNLSDNLQEDVGKMNAYSVPAPDTNNFFSVLDDIERETHATVSRIIEWFRTLSGVNVKVNASAGMSTAISGFAVAVPKAKGGFVKSADLVMANENGEFEMMGKMGNQPVVANNQQIVSGISRGVSEANGDVVGELRTVTTLMQRMLAKRWIAESVPSSRAGRANQQSADAYAKVTG